jgi:glycosyltransferase involved in cell wall biosynthesis
MRKSGKEPFEIGEDHPIDLASSLPATPSPRHAGADTVAVLVIPCFNEEQRLHIDAIASFLDTHASAELMFVDDGSVDKTSDKVGQLRAKYPDRVSLLRLARNSGKAEAVRTGVLAALERPTPYVGFWDADLATPLEALDGFLAEFIRVPQLELVMGARVQLLGRTIDRKGVRHYSGRVFATVVSLILKLPVYDTQCGAKLFRKTPTLRALFASPFLSRWAFDVEIIGRLAVERLRTGGPGPAACISELPLYSWRDVAGSKLRLVDIFRVSRDLLRIQRWLRKATRAAA